MQSLLVVVFILQLVIHLINNVGASSIDEFLWMIYNKLPTSTSKDVTSQYEIRRQLIALKRELSSISAQDQFARWAKLRRQHDTKQAEYDEKTNRLQSFKTTFDGTVRSLRFLCTNGLRFFLQFWYSKKPIFWLPVGLVPWYIEWILSFPRAPIGSVSIQIWGIACLTVIELVSSSVVAALVLGSGKAETGKKREPMKMEAETSGKKSNKKEL